MLDFVKKRNPDQEPDDDNQKTTGGPEPPPLPPLRTFVLREVDFRGIIPTERVVEAHGYAIDEARMISFFVFFIIDGKPLQAAKLLVNADAWVDVEEINDRFPVMEKH